jgi:hypothetical protein
MHRVIIHEAQQRLQEVANSWSMVVYVCFELLTIVYYGCSLLLKVVNELF